MYCVNIINLNFMHKSTYKSTNAIPVKVPLRLAIYCLLLAINLNFPLTYYLQFKVQPHIYMLEDMIWCLVYNANCGDIALVTRLAVLAFQQRLVCLFHIRYHENT